MIRSFFIMFFIPLSHDTLVTSLETRDFKFWRGRCLLAFSPSSFC
uniref:Uncharacterized protein n=1 Tax=Siphoviridae sp. ctLeh52 TaxID=2827849 RepID=A0A8S5RXB9_9CAUD|nr:MAG TPA: hypothetical protein [Siphoviridae sp. ctLeh52]DAG26571.1 MAG TPA: hypothetical protein [Bacteriophage sp.]DAG27345.1 MAG TPA: hypothetical protein [Caudoviricetes sp.]DAH31201.1 MAG TPA: hypothetical protein [Bacteriophage sp.]DAM96685.1 MAG TPA: hypothetical protein [Bacteriophage sp.]